MYALLLYCEIVDLWFGSHSSGDCKTVESITSLINNTIARVEYQSGTLAHSDFIKYKMCCISNIKDKMWIFDK
jgi:hypothetical protein